MYSNDFRWRAVTLVYVYGLDVDAVSRILGVSERTLRRWHQSFEVTGCVSGTARKKISVYPPDVLAAIQSFVKAFPCFYVDELREELKRQFAGRHLALSHATILRALGFDLRLSRRVLEKRAREALPLEIATYRAKLASFYTYPEQLVFIDETSKNGTDAGRRHAWSEIGTRAVVSFPFSRGARVSVLAACDSTGFIAWTTTRGTFTRNSFHDAFVRTVIPKLNPWPLPRSIVVIDNAKIHMYGALAAAVEQCGAILLYLPPNCPHLNPIELLFGRLKQWLVRHAHLAFPLYPELVLEVAMPMSLSEDYHGRHCGYGEHGLNEAAFAT